MTLSQQFLFALSAVAVAAIAAVSADAPAAAAAVVYEIQMHEIYGRDSM